MSQRMIYQTEETRSQILTVAEQLFLERGFFDTQMKDVAEAVGMSRNTLYRYYRDKTDLGLAILDAVLKHLLDDFRAALAGAAGRPFADCREQLTWVLEEVVLRQDHDTALRYIVEFDIYHSGNRVPVDFVAPRNQSPWAPIGAEFAAIIRAGIREGSIRDDFTPERLIEVIFIATKVMQQELLMRQASLRGSAEQMVQTLLILLTDGLKPQTP